MNANAGWIIPFIIIGGALQSCGAAMNGQLKEACREPVACFGHILCADYLLFRWRLVDPSEPPAYPKGLG